MSADTIIATCPECNEPIYDGEYIQTCHVKDCHIICHEYDAPVCASCWEFTCPNHLTTIDDDHYCPKCCAIVDVHMFDGYDIDEAAELAAQGFKERLGL